MKAEPREGREHSRGLIRKVEEGTAVVGVIGLGYVGLPLALAIANSGLRAVGFDIDHSKITTLMRNDSYISYVSGEEIARLRGTGRLSATHDFSLLAEVDAVLICVPTPLTRHREPDLSMVVSTTENVALYLRRGQLVVLESTTYPGTTKEIMRPILEKSGLQCGLDFLLAYSPEREDPGNADFSTKSIPKVVGADDESTVDAAMSLYSKFISSVVPMNSSSAAEAVKLTENIFRAVNIALVNELKVLFFEMGIDIWSVIDAAKTKPFGYMPFYPGPGLGGHCIPIDPFYLTWKAREFGISLRFIELAGEVNTSMPHYVVAKMAEALDRRFQRGLNKSKVLVIGLAYKKNVSDIRESPSLVLIELLKARGSVVDYHDPLVRAIPQTREHAALAGMQSVNLSPATLGSYDAVLIATDHDTVDYGLIAMNARLVVDTRDACRRYGVSGANIEKA